LLELAEFLRPELFTTNFRVGSLERPTKSSPILLREPGFAQPLLFASFLLMSLRNATLPMIVHVKASKTRIL
jgi:hypothetical protein